MANYQLDQTGAEVQSILDAVQDKETTRPVLNSSKLITSGAVRNALAEGYLYKGVADHTTNPGTPTEKVFYIATDPGTYSNFGTGISVAEGEVCILKYDTAWHKEVTGAATAAQVTELGQKVDVLDEQVGRHIDYINPYTYTESLGVIRASDGVWRATINQNFRHIVIPIADIGDIGDKFYVLRKTSDAFLMAFVSAYNVVLNGDASVISYIRPTAGEKTEVTIPNNAAYLYVQTCYDGVVNIPLIWISDDIDKAKQEIIYDVTLNNSGANFASLHALLSSENLSTLIPIAVRCGGMSIRFVQTSDNKYVQYRLTDNAFTTDVTKWQGVDSNPTPESKNLVESGGVIKYVLNRLLDVSLSDEAVDKEKRCINNFKYFVCKNASILSLSPRVSTIINSDSFPYRIGISFSEGSPVFIDGTGQKETDDFVFEYDWTKHTAEDDFNRAYAVSHIAVSNSSYSQAIAFVLNKLKSAQTSQAEVDAAIYRVINANTTVDEYNEYSQSTLDSYFNAGYYLKNGTIRYLQSATNYGVYGVPVQEGDCLRITIEKTDTFNDYDSIGFATSITQGGAYTVISGKGVDTDIDKTFIAPSNGYVLIWVQKLAWKDYIDVYDVENVLIRTLLQNGLGEEWLSDSVVDKLNGKTYERYPAFNKKIICSGSSITWGTGALDSSMVKYVDKFLKEKVSDIVLPDKMTYSGSYTEVSNTMLYNSYGRKISSINDTIEFDIYGDELVVCQMKRRTKDDFGIVEVYADNVLIGQFDNKNFIMSETESFADDDIVEIRLKHPCTFNHSITVNGSTVLSKIVYNTAGYGGTVPDDPDSFDAFVFRSLDDDGNPVHMIQFSSALGTITSVNISYDYGNIVAHERSTLGQTQDEYENESYYGSGTVSYDPAHPTAGLSSGMEFRAANKEAVFIHQFNTAATRHIKLKLVDGNNPYFIINYASNRYHDLMNAGIGGWKLSALIDNDKVNDYTQFFKWFKPELIFQESETNDDWQNGTRRIRRSIGEITLSELRGLPWLEVYSVTYNSGTDKYAVDMCTGIISSITPTSLISSDIVGTDTQVGDIIRIGNYHGDIKGIVCRKLTDVNLTTGEVKWIEPLCADEILNIDSLNDLVGAEINIRDLSGYKASYKTLIENIHQVTPEATIVVVENGLPMLYDRQLWGYDVIHREVVGESINAKYLDAREVLYNGQMANITGTRKETVAANGGSSYGLSFAGTHRSWYGFRVLVNGIDVYGKDCYIQSQLMYRAKSTLTGSDLNKTYPYDRQKADDSNDSINMQLVFTKNYPTSNDTVEVWFSDNIWSNDFCHPTEFGAFLYGQAYAKFIL